MWRGHGLAARPWPATPKPCAAPATNINPDVSCVARTWFAQHIPCCRGVRVPNTDPADGDGLQWRSWDRACIGLCGMGMHQHGAVGTFGDTDFDRRNTDADMHCLSSCVVRAPHAH